MVLSDVFLRLVLAMTALYGCRFFTAPVFLQLSQGRREPVRAR